MLTGLFSTHAWEIGVVRRRVMNAQEPKLLQDRRDDGAGIPDHGRRQVPKYGRRSVSNQTNTVTCTRRSGEVLRLLMFPDAYASRPAPYVHRLGNPLEITRDAHGKPRVVLSIDRGGPVLIELDPEHGWLPRKLSGGFEITVTRFARENGVWFPVEGTFRASYVDEAGKLKSRPERFRVSNLRINRPIADDRFTLPDELKALADDRGLPPAFGPHTIEQAGLSDVKVSTV